MSRQGHQDSRSGNSLSWLLDISANAKVTISDSFLIASEPKSTRAEAFLFAAEHALCFLLLLNNWYSGLRL